jgi:flagellar assembly factor FliW
MGRKIWYEELALLPITIINRTIKKAMLMANHDFDFILVNPSAIITQYEATSMGASY